MLSISEILEHAVAVCWRLSLSVRQMIRCEVSEQWRRFFFWKPRRKFKVDINDAGIDVINTWVDEIPISGQRRLGMGEKEKKISLLLSYIRPQFLPGCVPLLGSTQQSSHLCPHSCH
jgi:hypothetical protein